MATAVDMAGEEPDLAIIDEDNNDTLQQPNDPYDADEREMETRPTATGSSEPFAQDPSAARVIVPSAAVHDEDTEEVCGVCFEPLEAGKTAKMLCCRNKLCLNHAQRVGQCPYCREEPLIWGLE